MRTPHSSLPSGRTEPRAHFTEIASGFAFAESPRWHDNAFYVSDMYEGKIFRVGRTSRGGWKTESVVDIGADCGGIGWLPDGDLLVVHTSERIISRHRRDAPSMLHVDLSGVADRDLNDMIVLPDGSLYVGTAPLEDGDDDLLSRSPIYHVSRSGRVSVAAEGFFNPNGMALSPDRHHLLVNETFGQQISSFPAIGRGKIETKRTWCSLGPPLAPARTEDVMSSLTIALDGMAAERRGDAVWVADAIGHRVLRVTDRGIERQILTGYEQPFACAIGGINGDILCICLAKDFNRPDRIRLRDSRLVVLQIPVEGTNHEPEL